MVGVGATRRRVLILSPNCLGRGDQQAARSSRPAVDRSRCRSGNAAIVANWFWPGESGRPSAIAAPRSQGGLDSLGLRRARPASELRPQAGVGGSQSLLSSPSGAAGVLGACEARGAVPPGGHPGRGRAEARARPAGGRLGGFRRPDGRRCTWRRPRASVGARAGRSSRRWPSPASGRSSWRTRTLFWSVAPWTAPLAGQSHLARPSTGARWLRRQTLPACLPGNLLAAFSPQSQRSLSCGACRPPERLSVSRSGGNLFAAGSRSRPAFWCSRGLP